MLYCKKCGASMPDHSRFCSNCGMSFGIMNHPLPVVAGTGKKNKKKSGIWSTIIAGGISVVLVSVFLIYMFSASGNGTMKDKANEEDVEDTVTGALAFTAQTYEVETKQEMDMNQYLQCEGISREDVVWSTDSDELVVGSRGHVVLNDYGSSCTLVASSKNNENIRTECTIKSRSEEEDFVYLVESLNGKHSQDDETEDGVIRLAYSKEENQTIAPYDKMIEPAKKNKKYTWDKTLFYTLEEIDSNSNEDGKINTYWVEKKKFINKDTGNEIEYDIYHNPDNDKINKIVSIEYKKKKLDIVEYYYTNQKKVNFIYSFEDVNYTPSYATPNRDGERYLFSNDAMVTWRVVKNGHETNYCYGKLESRRVASGGHPNIKVYSRCSKRIKKAYNKKETEMLNAAYNTLEKVKKYEGVSTISGYVEMASGNGMKNVSVQLKSTDYGCELFTSTTDQEGYYEIRIPTRLMNYSLQFAKDSYLKENLYEIEADLEDINLSQEVVYLAEEDEQEYDCKLTFYDALNKAVDGNGMALLDNLDVAIRRGVNNKTGNTVYEGHISGDTKKISLTSGMYTVQMMRDGYMDSYGSLFVSAKTGNTLAIYATPKLNDDEYRIVLTWDEEPNDLDSHLFVPVHDMLTEDYHICYYHMSDSDHNTSLDVDDTDGYGPETTTINHIQNGQYKFYVCDYTNCCQNNVESDQMSNSSATVRIYGSKGLIQTFYVPGNQSGVIWEVFEIRNGIVIPTQRYYNSIGNKTWWHSDK